MILPNETMVCRECELEKAVEEFGTYKTKGGKVHRRLKCKRCTADRVIEWKVEKLATEVPTHSINGYIIGCRCDICVASWTDRKFKDFSRRQEILATIKLERGCADCGYNEFSCALDFDHRPGEEKLFLVSRSQGKGLEEVLLEIAKCDVVCAICHRIRTVLRAGGTLHSFKELM